MGLVIRYQKLMGPEVLGAACEDWKFWDQQYRGRYDLDDTNKQSRDQ